MAGDFKKSLIIARDADDAKLIKKWKHARSIKILTLTPSAKAEFVGQAEFNSFDTVAVYSDMSHARATLQQKHGMEEFVLNAKQLTLLSEIQIGAARKAIFYIFGFTSFFDQLLRGYECFYIVEKGKIKLFKSKPEILKKIIADVTLDKKYDDRSFKFSRFHKLIVDAYNSYVVRKLGAAKKILYIDGVRPSSRAFVKAAITSNYEYKVLRSRNISSSIFISLKIIRRSISALRKNDLANVPAYFFFPAKTRSYSVELDKIIAATKNKLRQQTLKHAHQYLEEILNSAAGYEISVKQEFAALKPNVILADAIDNGFSRSVAKYSNETGAKLILFNHASHSVQTSPISKTTSDLWVSHGRIYSKEADVMAVRSPIVAELIKERFNEENKVIGVRHDEIIPPVKKEKFTILFAGNFTGAKSHVPWVIETPDEFLEGVKELVEAVGQIPDAQLIIRVKARKVDCGLEAMQKLLPHYPNVEISNSGSFKNDLANADLLVANISTTIEEALQSGRPVLLHSGPKRYRHLKAMTNSPTAQNRSAIYASTKSLPLVDLMKGIIAAHKNRLLTQSELAPYTWPLATPDMTGFVSKVLEK